MHTPAISLLTLAAKHGWSVKLKHGKSMDGQPNIQVEGSHKARGFWLHWINTGDGYRLHSCIGESQPFKPMQDMTLTKVRAMVKGASNA